MISTLNWKIRYLPATASQFPSGNTIIKITVVVLPEEPEEPEEVE